MLASAVPHLTTALSGPLSDLEKHLIGRHNEVESWLRRQWREAEHTVPFYASVDLRNAGFKMAPVDANLFPAGFNNLNPAFEPLCAHAVQQLMSQLGYPVDRVLVIVEDHTRNVFYLRHLTALERILEQAGFEVVFGSLTVKDQQEHDPGDGVTVNVSPVKRVDNLLRAGDFVPDVILLNNDLSHGVTPMLEGVEQQIMPHYRLGWAHRSKVNYFRCYQKVASDFAEAVGLSDPWLIEPLFHDCGSVDFMNRQGEECLKSGVADLLDQIHVLYRRYDVKSDPFVVIKADTGTYGMAVMTARSPDDVVGLNRKQRVRMSTTKGGRPVTRVLLQEGVPTQETWGDQNNTAEPVVYLIGNQVVGGFYRVHAERGAQENLNTPGMTFAPLAFDECCMPPARGAEDKHCNRFYSYGVIARLAVLATAAEAREVEVVTKAGN